jgi:hypothetical protein
MRDLIVKALLGQSGEFSRFGNPVTHKQTYYQWVTVSPKDNSFKEPIEHDFTADYEAEKVKLAGMTDEELFSYFCEYLIENVH